MKLTNNTALGENETLHLKAVDKNKIMAAIIEADIVAMLLPDTRVELDCFSFTIALPVEGNYSDIYKEYKKWKQTNTK